MSRQLLITLGPVALVGGIFIAVFGVNFAPNIVVGLGGLSAVGWAMTRRMRKNKDPGQTDWWNNFQ